MFQLSLSLYAAAICASLLVLVSCRNFKPESQAIMRTMRVLLIIFTAIFIAEWIDYHPDMPQSALWLSMVMGLNLTIAPLCCVLTSRVVLATNAERARKARQVSILGKWGAVLLLPLFSAIVYSNMLQLPVSSTYSLVIHTTMIMAILVYLLQSAVAYRFSNEQLTQRQVENTHLFSQSADPGHMLIQSVVFFMLFNAAINSIRLLYCAFFDDILLVDTLIALVQTLCMFVFCYSLIRMQSKGFWQQEKIRESVFASSSANKYEKSSISFSRRQGIQTKLAHLLDVEKIHIQAGVSLRDLAEKIGETPQVLSQVINESEYGSFHQMINSRRVEVAQRLLIEQPTMTVLAVAFECGFNSKSTFNAVFKNQLGLSPSQYRKRECQIASQAAIGVETPPG